jgi:phosphate transport system substrate-binding protein
MTFMNPSCAVRTSRILSIGLAALALAACGPAQPPAASGDSAPATGRQARAAAAISIDGSSTVFPISEAIAEEFQMANRGMRVTVGVSGTGGGMKRFCRGEVDIANASRPIQKEEMAACESAGIRYFELPVAYDALTVVVNPRNDWVSEITIEELRKIWEPAAQGTITRWNQVNPDWPDRPINLYGAGADSGTFDYFTEVVTGKAKSSRGDFTASEDDNVLVQGVANDVNALGYMGFAYYVDNRDKMRSLAIAPGEGKPAVQPSIETVIDGSYMPLSRPMFIYVNAAAYERADVRAFLDFYLDNVGRLAEDVNYVPLPAEAYAVIRRHLEEGRLGTVFKGEPATAVSIEKLLEKETAF